jgi:hypothetical protein
MDLKVLPDDGEPYDLVVKSRDILAWERVTKGMTFSKLQDDLNMGHVYNLAWRAASRTRKFAGTLEDFEENHDIDIVVPDDEDGGPNPTNAAA